MRLTKYTHACLRLEDRGSVLVIDPGTLSEPAALDGVDAVLITHEHADHVDITTLGTALAGRPSATVYAHPDVVPLLADLPGRRTAVEAGEEFTAAGFTVRAYGGRHAVVHPDIPIVANLGFLVDGSVYHPGDSYVVPDGAAVEALFVPVSGPWVVFAASVDFVREVQPRRGYALHDGLLNGTGNQIMTRIMGQMSDCDYQWLESGTSIHV